MLAHVFRAVLVAAASFLTYKILGIVFELAKYYYFRKQNNFNIGDTENKSYLHNQIKTENNKEEKNSEDNNTNEENKL